MIDADIDRQRLQRVSRESLGDFCAAWLGEYRESGVGARTIEDAETTFRTAGLVPATSPLATVRLDQLNPYLLQKEVTAIGKKRGYWAASAFRSHLHRALASAVPQGDLASNPAAGLKLPPKPQDTRRRLTQPEAQRIVAHAEADPTPSTVFPALSLFLGLRPQECAALRWNALNEDGSVIKIHHACVWLTDGSTTVGPCKTQRSHRELDVSGWLLALLVAYRKVYGATIGLPVGSAFMFPSPSGGPPNYVMLASRWEVVRRKLGLDGIGLYKLRHCHASSRALAGESPASIAQQLGHTSVKLVLDTYVTPLKKPDGTSIARALGLAG